MAIDFRQQAEECLKKDDYEGYVFYTKKIYEDTKNEEDLENYKKAKSMLELYNEIQEILKKEKSTCYDILEIDKNSTMDQIKTAFRVKASRYHPDRAAVKGANDAMRIIQKAYFEINTQEKKDAYDRKTAKRPRFYNPYNTNPFENIEDIFNNASSQFNYSVYTTNTGSVFSGIGTTPMMSFLHFYNNLYRRRQPTNRSRQQTPTFEQGSSVFIVIFFVILAMLFG